MITCKLSCGLYYTKGQNGSKNSSNVKNFQANVQNKAALLEALQLILLLV